MNFTTAVPITKSKIQIDYQSKIFSFGSCFVENMASKFDYYKFQNSCNPFGILFHPIAIENIISRAINLKLFDEKDLFFNNERWHNFDIHSDLSNPDKEAFLNEINNLLVATNKNLQEANHVIITFGTSWVYRNKESNKLVANCHKVPQNNFNKELLSVYDIEIAIQNTVNLIEKINPSGKIIFTISPVRHLKDGFVENQRSKANLIAGLHSVLSPQNPFIDYFPSYEIMMDELRDYRFYAEDLLHPNQLAIDYIWERFVESFVSNEAISTMNEVESIQRDLSHRPFNPSSESHQKFKIKLKSKIEIVKSKFPFMNFKL
jgi:hypothetical protein